MIAHAKIPPPKMTLAEFHRWVAAQPEGRYELVRGVVVRLQQSERVRHAVVKGNVYRALQDAVRAAGLPCRVFPDGVTVDITDAYSYQPDAAVQCGVTVDLDATTIAAPMIVVEVLSPSSANTDGSEKLADYFTLASVAHVLIIDPVLKRVFKHSRRAAASIALETLSEGDDVVLDPPGLRFAVANCFVEI